MVADYTELLREYGKVADTGSHFQHVTTRLRGLASSLESVGDFTHGELRALRDYAGLLSDFPQFREEEFRFTLKSRVGLDVGEYVDHMYQVLRRTSRLH